MFQYCQVLIYFLIICLSGWPKNTKTSMNVIGGKVISVSMT